MFYCDIDRSGVDFCAETLGGHGIYSEPDLTAVDLPGDLDLIWVGSLFTHVDEARTKLWLEHLSSRLSPMGVLVATFHGLYSIIEHSLRPMINPTGWAEIMRQFEQGGYGYAAYTEHDMGDYGVSLVRPSKLIDIATSIPETRVLSFTERAWANNHDVLVVAKPGRASLIRI